MRHTPASRYVILVQNRQIRNFTINIHLHNSLSTPLPSRQHLFPPVAQLFLEKILIHIPRQLRTGMFGARHNSILPGRHVPYPAGTLVIQVKALAKPSELTHIHPLTDKPREMCNSTRLLFLCIILSPQKDKSGQLRHSIGSPVRINLCRLGRVSGLMNQGIWGGLVSQLIHHSGIRTMVWGMLEKRKIPRLYYTLKEDCHIANTGQVDLDKGCKFFSTSMFPGFPCMIILESSLFRGVEFCSSSY